MNARDPIDLVPERVSRSRGVESIVAGQQVMDGAGVKINRVLSGALQRRLDPYLMLDAFRSDDPDDYLAGFPDHPHRGFETVTYMIAGRMRHRDSAGHEGLLQNGGVQWMNAGRGVIHSELPEQEGGTMEGFQLWLNLPAATKMSDPWYRDIPAEAIPQFVTAEGALVRVIAGASHGVFGAVRREITEPLYLDVELPAGAGFAQTLPAECNAFLYVYRGEIEVVADNGGDRSSKGVAHAVAERRMAILASAGETDGVADGVIVSATRAARFLLIAGKPLKEAIVQYGPFVMNTRAEIEATLRDFRDGHFAAA